MRERELGTLEQLFVTPVGRMGLLLGKLVPYAMVGFVEMLIVLSVMIYVFGVPINGSIALLLVLSMLFMVCSLGLGLLVSTVAKNPAGSDSVRLHHHAAVGAALGLHVSRAARCRCRSTSSPSRFPVTYFIEILRGIVLRGADLLDLLPSVVGLTICGFVVLWLSVMRFQKRLT